MERLKVRAMNQKAFIQTSDADGVKGGKGGGRVEGMETCGAMEESCQKMRKDGGVLLEIIHDLVCGANLPSSVCYQPQMM